MRKLYDKYFSIPEQGSGIITEKKFFARLILSVVCMALCMFAIGYNAYAYFSSTIESTANVLQASTYSLDVDVKCVQENQGSAEKDSVVEGRYVLQPGAYKFTIKKSESSTASTGYCRIDIGVKDVQGETQYEKRYYTQQIGAVAGQEEPVYMREVVIFVDEVTVVQFETCWGTFAGEENILEFDKVIAYREGRVTLLDTVPELTIEEVVEESEEETTEESNGTGTEEKQEEQEEQNGTSESGEEVES